MYLIFKVKYFRFMQNADTNIFYLLLAILSALVLSLRELYHYSSNFNTTSLDRCMIAILSLWWWIVFVLWLTDERRLALFPAGTTARDPDHRESLTRREQGLRTCAEPEFRLSWVKLCSSDNHYTTAPSSVVLVLGCVSLELTDTY